MAYQEDLILSIYGRGEPGLAMADPLPKDDPNRPVKAPGKDGVPSSPYLPGKSPMPSKQLANLADGEPDPSIMNYVTVGGFFLDGQGRAYMQTGGKLYDAGEYNPDLHGLPVPLVQQMQINPMIAHAGPGQFYTEEGEVTDVSPYTFNRNTTELEVPWLKQQYEQNLPQYQNQHMKIYHGG